MAAPRAREGWTADDGDPAGSAGPLAPSGATRSPSDAEVGRPGARDGGRRRGLQLIEARVNPL